MTPSSAVDAPSCVDEAEHLGDGLLFMLAPNARFGRTAGSVRRSCIPTRDLRLSLAETFQEPVERAVGARDRRIETICKKTRSPVSCASNLGCARDGRKPCRSRIEGRASRQPDFDRLERRPDQLAEQAVSDRSQIGKRSGLAAHVVRQQRMRQNGRVGTLAERHRAAAVEPRQRRHEIVQPVRTVGAFSMRKPGRPTSGEAIPTISPIWSQPVSRTVL